MGDKAMTATPSDVLARWLSVSPAKAASAIIALARAGFTIVPTALVREAMMLADGMAETGEQAIAQYERDLAARLRACVNK